LNDVGSSEDEVVVAAFEALTAKIFRSEVEALDGRAHRAVVDEDAFFELSKVG